MKIKRTIRGKSIENTDASKIHLFNGIIDERDGLLMRVQALEAKINGQEKHLEMRAKAMKDLMAQADAANRTTRMIVTVALERAYNKGVDIGRTTISAEPPTLLEEIEQEGDTE